MEFSEIFGFLKLLKESMKIIVKNVIGIASITTLTLALSSIIFFIFSFSSQSTSYMMTHASTTAGYFISFTLNLAAIFIFMISFVVVGHVSFFATVITAATSYAADTKLSLHDLFILVKGKWRSPFTSRKSSGRRSTTSMALALLIIVVTVALMVVVLFPNPATFTIVGVVGVSAFVFYLYVSVAGLLAAVVMVVEDGCEAAEAVEKAEKLVRGGQRIHGFMVNLFSHVVGLIVLLSWWMFVGDKWSSDAYALLFVNAATATFIFSGVAYTVYYFRCKEYHGEQIQLLENFQYTASV